MYSFTKIAIFFLFISWLVTSCGQSIFSNFDEKTPEERIILFLEEDKPQDALNEINKELEKNPNDSKLLSLKSAAIAQFHGIDTISLALKMAENQSSTSGEEKNEITSLFSVLPLATDTAITGLQEAIDILTGIADKKTSDYFKLTMLNSSLMALRIKQIDSDGSGSFTVDELLAMDVDDVINILSNLDGAILATVGASGIDEGQGSKDSLGAISSIKTKISTQDGDTDEEKLKNYLQNNSTN